LPSFSNRFEYNATILDSFRKNYHYDFQKIHYSVFLPQYLEKKISLKAILPKVESKGHREIMQSRFNPIDLQ
jgi:hypothetical protein